MKMHLLFVVICASLLAKNSMSAVTINHTDKFFELLILHNNDMHARFEQTSALSSTCNDNDVKNGKCYGGFARVANRVRDARLKASKGESPPVLYLNAGDTYTGTVWFTVYKWEIAAAFINIIKPDAVSLGNHEFDNGVSGLTPFVENLTCPILCANIDLQNEPDLEKEANLKKSTIFEIEGVKVGVIGYLTPDTKFLVSPNRVEYEDEVVAIQREVDRLKKDDIKILIALGHSGFETDKRIARDVEGIDLVIGGHTNTFLWNGKVPDLEESQGPYPTIVEQPSKKKVPVVQAYAYTKYLGRLHVKFDSNGDLISFDGEPILLNNSIPQDKDVLELLETYRPGVLALRKEVVGVSNVLLGGPGSICRVQECNIGNLLTDAMVFKYMLDYEGDNGWTDAPIAIMQGGGIRTSIDAEGTNGNITKADLLAVLPFDNPIVAVNISGKYLRESLEVSVYNYDLIEAPGSFLQFSGLIVSYDLSKPSGSRVVSAKARCGLCKIPVYSDLEDDKYYKVLVPIFLYNGGDGYDTFKDNSVSSEVMKYYDVDTIVSYLQYKSPISPDVHGRVTFVGNGEKNGVENIISSLHILMLCSSVVLFNVLC